jgi:hypothetical protein
MRALLVMQVGWLVLVIGSREMWYSAYLAPLTAFGIGAMAQQVLDSLQVVAPDRASRRARTMALGLAAVCLSTGVTFAKRNIVASYRLAKQQQAAEGDLDYGAMCAGVSRHLPEGSRVMLATIPDPWLGLVERRDLVLRQFAPTGIPVHRGAWHRALVSMDYLVTGRHPISPQVEEFAARHAVVQAEVGQRDGSGPYARIHRVIWPGEIGTVAPRTVP